MTSLTNILRDRQKRKVWIAGLLAGLIALAAGSLHFWADRNTSVAFAAVALGFVLGALVLASRGLDASRRAARANELIAGIVGASTDAIIALTPDATIASWNGGAEEIFGYSSTEAVGRHITMLASPSDRPLVNANLATVLGGRRIVGQENTRRRKDGTPVDISLSASPIVDRSGKVRGVAAVLRDISRSKAAEAARRQSERELAAVFRASPIGILVTRVTDGVILDINDSALALTGLTREATVGRTTLDIGYWLDTARVSAIEQQLRTDESVRNVELQCRGAGDRKLDVVTSWSRIVIGGEECTVALIDDLTAERAAERDNERLFSLSSDIIAVVGFDGRIQRVNPAGTSILGFSEEEFRATPFLDLIRPEDREAVTEIFSSLRAGAISSALWEGDVRGEDGSYRRLEVVAACDHDQGTFLSVSRDVSARHEMELEVEAARIVATEANQAKNQFLSRMSHELRTPLNVVLGFGQVLELDPLEPDQAEAVSHILNAGRHLLSLIDEVLDISRIEAGRISLSIEPVSVSAVISESVELMSTLAADRGVLLRVNGCDTTILVDRQRLKQVLMNLLSNAIKYNHRGGRVDVSCESSEEGYLRLVVTDTGIGIAPDKLPRLFTPFDRLGVEATGIEGTGLGLSLAKHLTEAMNGHIGASSTQGAGSTFWVEVPIAEDSVAIGAADETIADSRVQSPGHAAIDNALTILYIEDNLANLNLMERVLVGRQGCRLLAAMQGSLGLQLARDHHPDLILLDLHLPDMMGHDVLRELRVDPETRTIPVIVVSADATQGQIARLLEAGAQAYLTKPIDIRELISLTQSLAKDNG